MKTASICELELVSFPETLAEISKQIIQFSEDIPVWLFEGEMGAGKTTLIKEICKSFGVTETVSSPTFSLVNEYQNDKRERFYHFDFYRIKSEEEASDIGVDEYFYSDDYCFVEWPSKIPSLIPDAYVTIKIEVLSENERKICLSKKVDV